jgi:subtilase family serine protease
MLVRGLFDQRYAPFAASHAAVGRYLRWYGLTAQRSASPFLVRAAGTSQQVPTAFRTTLSTYQQPGGAHFFVNSRPIQLPATLAAGALGVISLTDTFQSHRSDAVAIPPKMTASQQASAGCETPYPTVAQLQTFVSSGTSFPFGYGTGRAAAA